MVKKIQTQRTESVPEIEPSVNFDDGNSTAEKELRARQIISMMTEAAKIRDLQNRRQIAENLGRILSGRKDRLNLSELVVCAGISENPDPSRLGRFRILPRKKLNRAAIRRLSQDALAYVRLVRETAKVTGEDYSTLIEELVLGTKFDPSGLEGVEIEPFEQLHTLIQKKIDALDAKFDLDTYFRNIREHSLSPIWSHGPKYGGRIASHHSPDRPNIVGWKKDPYHWNHETWRFQSMPCVPLCRVKSNVGFSYSASIRSGKFRDVGAYLQLYKRLYLAIGMFDSEYVSDMETGERVTFNDTVPLPYLILADEFHYSPSEEFLYSNDHRNFRPTLAGGLECQSSWPLFFHDDRAEFEIEIMDSEFIMEPGSETDEHRFWGGPFDDFETARRLDLVLFRKIFGMPMSGKEGSFAFDKLKTFLNQDALYTNELTMTLAPRGTIAELIESNLMSSSVGEDHESAELSLNILDRLERDVRLMTSSLEKFMGETRSRLNKKHEGLMEKFDREYEEAKKQRR